MGDALDNFERKRVDEGRVAKRMNFHGEELRFGGGLEGQWRTMREPPSGDLSSDSKGKIGKGKRGR